ncbi:flavodoxin [Methanosarcinales archaeon ex4484_138]|nr:MAG: flavodoxin [Methanosarcinales archaeon ex4484_138]RLG26281.1 MAG: FprA family A-type flavoprotein [Methanosarcinales archaeon]
MTKLEVLYLSQVGHTREMANAIVAGARKKGVDVVIKPVHMVLSLKEIEDADAIAIGAPTHNTGVPGQVSSLLSKMKSLNLGGKPAAAFGSYGFSGEAPELIAERMRSMDMDVLGVIKTLKKADETTLGECRRLGKEMALRITSR